MEVGGWLRTSRLAALLSALLLTASCSDDSAGPVPPSATATPRHTATSTPTAIPGDWQPFETGAISIAVPPQYVGGNPGDDQTLAAMRALGGACVEAAGAIEQFREESPFAAVDRETCSTTARVVLVLSVVSSATTPSAFAEEFVMRLGAGGTLIDFKEASIGGQPAGFMHIRRMAGEPALQAGYAVLTGGAWHLISASTAEEDFAVALPTFDAIAATFRAR